MYKNWKSLLISIITPSGIMSGISLTVLWGYFARLDRLDVFFDVMNIKSIFILVGCAAALSLLTLLIIFFITSFLIPVVIPQDINNLPAYEKIQTNLLLILMISGLFPMLVFYLLYFAFATSQAVKDNSGWLSISATGLITIIASVMMNMKLLERDLSIKNHKTRWIRRGQIYLVIPFGIALLALLQVFPLEVVFRNIDASDEIISFWAVLGLACISYMVFFLTLFPGLVFLRMNAKDRMIKKVSTSFLASLMVLLLISTKITVVPVIFTHSVIKLAGISDFSKHTYIIKTSDYPDEFFSDVIWRKKIVKKGEYYAIQAVSLFTTNKFSLLCPDAIIKSYRESWKFNPWDTAFDNKVRLKLQKQAAYCVPLSASSLKRWDAPL